MLRRTVHPQMPSELDIPAILGSTQIFGALDQGAREAVAAKLRPVTFAAGHMVFGRGDQGRELYIVLSGRVRLSVLTTDARELTFSHASAGAIFGEIAMLDGKARTADATAVEETHAMLLSRADLDDLMVSTPELVQAVIAFVCSRLREADMQLEGVALHRIDVRLARFLVGLAQQARPEQEAGSVDIELGMSQSELALLLGASRPKVNGAMKMLEDQGIIERSGARLRFDIDEVRCIAQIE
jgi:CRP/FNR family transcriptional regulator, cyclic AMP receptor protein